jgi:catechol 2,3-dioxygenase-like lactoylglutathione lyase family enzyme
MQIVGLDDVVFGVEDMEAATQFLRDYGLIEVSNEGDRARFEALDGTGVVLRPATAADLPSANVQGSTSRLTIWGCKDQATVDAIAEELSKDRQVQRHPDGMIQTVDDDNMGIAFRVSRRRDEFEAPLPMQNAPGSGRQRPVNHRVDFKQTGKAHGVGHIVYWSPDPDQSIKFYVERLGFRVTDLVRNKQGVFARAAGSADHHNVFFLGRADAKPSFQHLEFHFTDMQEVIAGGSALTNKGWKTAFGPGRHELGSNWYWYFQTPMGGAFELGSDIDHVDDQFEAGVWDSLGDVAGWSMAFMPPTTPSEGSGAKPPS